MVGTGWNGRGIRSPSGAHGHQPSPLVDFVLPDCRPVVPEQAARVPGIGIRAPIEKMTDPFFDPVVDEGILPDDIGRLFACPCGSPFRSIPLK